MTTEREKILTALEKHISQRSGIEWGNYGGSRDAFMGDYRPILRHGRDARDMLRWVAIRESISADDIKAGFRAYSGRLSWDGNRIDYCAGQYFPTEYRSAACAVLANIIWHYLAQDCKTGDEIRARAKREFGRGIASRWFR